MVVIWTASSTIAIMHLSLKLVFLFSAQEVKEHPFFKGIDWTQVFLQKYPPPLIPPRGEVNAADAFDIGSFDEEDTKGIKVPTITSETKLVALK